MLPMFCLKARHTGFFYMLLGTTESNSLLSKLINLVFITFFVILQCKHIISIYSCSYLFSLVNQVSLFQNQAYMNFPNSNLYDQKTPTA